MRIAPLALPVWRTARGALPLDRPRILGIINVTPDSFWDGSRQADAGSLLAHAERLLGEGADILDVGGESTRPGARAVSVAEERRRVVPVIAALAERWPDVLLSVDTVKSEVARAALEAGAAIINDVSGLRLDPRIAEVAARLDAGLIIMHSRGTVEDMASYVHAVYGDDPVGEVAGELAAALDRARAAGIAADRLVIDPGLGFAKRTADSVAVLAGLERLTELGVPVLVGPSRKRFVGDLAGGLPPEQRLEGTLAACVIAWLRGARLFRVHDVGAARRALAVAAAVQESVHA
jgi:dihydropteroate synthase